MIPSRMTKSFPDSLVVVSLDGQSIALDAARVERIVEAVAIAPLPGAPAGVRGVVNFQGTLVPVFDPRLRFGLPERELRATDHLVFAHGATRLVALLVEGVVDVIEADSGRLVPSEAILPSLPVIEGVMKLNGDLVFIYDLDRFLSAEGERELSATLPG